MDHIIDDADMLGALSPIDQTGIIQTVADLYWQMAGVRQPDEVDAGQMIEILKAKSRKDAATKLDAMEEKGLLTSRIIREGHRIKVYKPVK